MSSVPFCPELVPLSVTVPDTTSFCPLAIISFPVPVLLFKVNDLHTAVVVFTVMVNPDGMITSSVDLGIAPPFQFEVISQLPDAFAVNVFAKDSLETRKNKINKSEFDFNVRCLFVVKLSIYVFIVVIFKV
jgi:hypothetical protein